MSAVGLESIEHTAHVTHTWITELDQRLGWTTRRVLSTARSVLQALRDWLPVNEVADFAAYSQICCAASIMNSGGRQRRRSSPAPSRIFSGVSTTPLSVIPSFTPKTPCALPFGFLSTKIAAGEIADIDIALPATSCMWTLSCAAA